MPVHFNASGVAESASSGIESRNRGGGYQDPKSRSVRFMQQKPVQLTAMAMNE